MLVQEATEAKNNLDSQQKFQHVIGLNVTIHHEWQASSSCYTNHAKLLAQRLQYSHVNPRFLPTSVRRNLGLTLKCPDPAWAASCWVEPPATVTKIPVIDTQLLGKMPNTSIFSHFSFSSVIDTRFFLATSQVWAEDIIRGPGGVWRGKVKRSRRQEEPSSKLYTHARTQVRTHASTHILSDAIPTSLILHCSFTCSYEPTIPCRCSNTSATISQHTALRGSLHSLFKHEPNWPIQPRWKESSFKPMVSDFPISDH